MQTQKSGNSDTGEGWIISKTMRNGETCFEIKAAYSGKPYFLNHDFYF